MVKASMPHLFKLEDVLVEVILQVLIGVVDAELLKTVTPKVLKPKDVQNTNGVALSNDKHSIQVTKNSIHLIFLYMMR
jgi:hypothetical protein